MARLGEPPRQAGPAAGWPVELTRSVVQILDAAGRPAGTGFVVGPQMLVTCAHILTDHDRDEPPADPITVVFAHLDGARRTGRVDPRYWRGPGGADVAFLHVAEPLPTHAQQLVLGGSPGVGGHRVKTFGFPVNAPSAGHYGYGVAGDQIEGDGGTPLLQLTGCTEVTEGFSGGPVLDQRTGLVIGMVNSISSPDPHGRGRSSAYVTPTETLRDICAELTVSQLRPYRGLEPFSTADAAWFY
jgi:hypothetical protein